MAKGNWFNSYFEIFEKKIFFWILKFEKSRRENQNWIVQLIWANFSRAETNFFALIAENDQESRKTYFAQYFEDFWVNSHRWLQLFSL